MSRFSRLPQRLIRPNSARSAHTILELVIAVIIAGALTSAGFVTYQATADRTGDESARLSLVEAASYAQGQSLLNGEVITEEIALRSIDELSGSKSFNTVAGPSKIFTNVSVTVAEDGTHAAYAMRSASGNCVFAHFGASHTILSWFDDEIEEEGCSGAVPVLAVTEGVVTDDDTGEVVIPPTLPETVVIPEDQEDDDSDVPAEDDPAEETDPEVDVSDEDTNEDTAAPPTTAPPATLPPIDLDDDDDDEADSDDTTGDEADSDERLEHAYRQECRVKNNEAVIGLSTTGANAYPYRLFVAATDATLDSGSFVDGDELTLPYSPGLIGSNYGLALDGVVTTFALADAGMCGGYDFGGFNDLLSPPFLNGPMNPGRTIPHDFNLGGYHGMDIVENGYPKSQRIFCDNVANTDDAELLEAWDSGKSSFRYIGNRYRWNWQTEKGWGGQCRKFILQLNDGSEHWSFWQFKEKHGGGGCGKGVTDVATGGNGNGNGNGNSNGNGNGKGNGKNK